ncbi:hypothetical protein [Micromonospora phaseoli]|uniref:hypothetical protein n=1 Tax=Micromonospora phaseoli TaxID=1144548 RepID=UPI001474F7CC|nr:hypothetical protein [Micromonospora phaseoli]
MSRVPVIRRVAVAHGDVVRLAETDYRYADGPLRLRVVRVRLEGSRRPGRVNPQPGRVFTTAADPVCGVGATEAPARLGGSRTAGRRAGEGEQVRGLVGVQPQRPGERSQHVL